MTGSRYIVSGGEFTNTDFQTVIPNTAERYGPFDTYEQALKEWRERTWARVDTCCHRVVISEV